MSECRLFETHCFIVTSLTFFMGSPTTMLYLDICMHVSCVACTRVLA